jgi:cysteine sulfinate desulfinase/cysteine desulfurase-like protein
MCEACTKVNYLNIVQNEMNRMGINILGVSEMKWTGSGHFKSLIHTVMYSGHDTHRKNGVGIIVTKPNTKITYRLHNSE